MNRVSSLLACAGTFGATLVAVVALGFAGMSSGSANAAPPAPLQSGFGTIKGRLVWGGSEIPKPAPITQNKEKDPQVCAAVPLFSRELMVDPESKGIPQAFAFLVSPKGKNPEAEKALLTSQPKVEIDQKNCEFIPFSTAMHKDQTIVFKSSDAVGHNVHYTGFVNNKNFALGPNGSSEEKLAAEKRPINLVCDIHPWMNGNIMVFDHPFFAVTGPDGSFEIKGVPAGSQNIIVWQRKAGYVTSGGSRGQQVDVKPGQVVDIGDIVLEPSKVRN